MAIADYSYIFIDLKNRKIEAGLSCSCKKSGGYYIAKCPELDIVDQGRTQREAIYHLSKNVAETLITAIELGKLEGMLKELGFRKGQVIPDRTVFKQTVESVVGDFPLSVEAPLPFGNLPVAINSVF